MEHRPEADETDDLNRNDGRKNVGRENPGGEGMMVSEEQKENDVTIATTTTGFARSNHETECQEKGEAVPQESVRKQPARDDVHSASAKSPRSKDKRPRQKDELSRGKTIRQMSDETDRLDNPVAGRSWLDKQRHANIAGVLFDRKYPRDRRRRPPSSLNDMAEHFVIPEAMPEILPAIAVQVVGNTIPPPLPHSAPEVWPEIWSTRPDPVSLLVDSASRENHWDISSDMRDLLQETLSLACHKEAASIVEAAIGPMDLAKVLASLPRLNCRNEQPFITANMRGRVDGIIRLMPSTSYVLVFEIKPLKKGSGDGPVDSTTAKQADDQVRQRAKSIHLNKCYEPVILLSVIGCCFRPYLWINNTIRPSDFDVPVHDSTEVRYGPSPMLWLDLRTDIGKKTFQQVVLDVLRRRPLSPEMYGAVGDGAPRESFDGERLGGKDAEDRTARTLSELNEDRTADID